MNIEHLRKFCLSLPGVTEAIRWDHHLNFYIGEKMFCIGTLDAEGRVSFRVPDDEFDEFTQLSYVVPSAYLARMKWVMVERYEDLADTEWEFFLRRSYALIREKLPKRVQDSLPEFTG